MFAPRVRKRCPNLACAEALPELSVCFCKLPAFENLDWEQVLFVCLNLIFIWITQLSLVMAFSLSKLQRSECYEVIWFGIPPNFSRNPRHVCPFARPPEIKRGAVSLEMFTLIFCVNCAQDKKYPSEVCNPTDCSPSNLPVCWRALFKHPIKIAHHPRFKTPCWTPSLFASSQCTNSYVHKLY